MRKFGTQLIDSRTLCKIGVISRQNLTLAKRH